MGRYVAFGIATEVYVYKKGWVSNEDFESLKDELKETMSNCIDIEKYILKEDENILKYRIEENFVNRNLHSFLKEANKLVKIKNSGFYTLNQLENYVERDDFDRTNYPLWLKFFTEDDSYESEYRKIERCNNYGLVSLDDVDIADEPFYTENVWMLSNRKQIDTVKIYTSYINIWLDFNKIDGEDETSIIRIMNALSRKYFENPLGKCSHFYIHG